MSEMLGHRLAFPDTHDAVLSLGTGVSVLAKQMEVRSRSMTIKHGQIVRDIITGFKGTVTARCEYITGCNQVLVQPKVKESGEWVESQWFDEDRMEVLESKPISLHVENAGPDKPAPRK